MTPHNEQDAIKQPKKGLLGLLRDLSASGKKGKAVVCFWLTGVTYLIVKLMALLSGGDIQKFWENLP